MASRAILLQPLDNPNFSSLDQKHSWFGLDSFPLYGTFQVSGSYEQGPGQTSAPMTLQIWITMKAVKLGWIRIVFSWRP